MKSKNVKSSVTGVRHQTYTYKIKLIFKQLILLRATNKKNFWDLTYITVRGNMIKFKGKIFSIYLP